MDERKYGTKTRSGRPGYHPRFALILFIAILAFNLCSCDKHPQKTIEETTELQVIDGRDDGQGRLSLYRVQAPISWIRHDPLPTDSLKDTTKFLCEFIIMDNDDIIRIAIHNFPSLLISDRISSQAQVARWQRQITSLDPLTTYTIPQSFSGYSGLLFFGEGKMDEKEVAILSWSLQIAPEHYRNLQQEELTKNPSIYSQMRADVTIKAVGPKHSMRKHKQAITKFARSFELIREIPTRT